MRETCLPCCWQCVLFNDLEAMFLHEPGVDIMRIAAYKWSTQNSNRSCRSCLTILRNQVQDVLETPDVRRQDVDDAL